MGSQVETPRTRLQPIPVSRLKKGMHVWSRGEVTGIVVTERPPDDYRGMHQRQGNPRSLLVAYVTFVSGETLGYGMREKILLEHPE